MPTCPKKCFIVSRAFGDTVAFDEAPRCCQRIAVASSRYARLLAKQAEGDHAGGEEEEAKKEFQHKLSRKGVLNQSEVDSLLDAVAVMEKGESDPARKKKAQIIPRSRLEEERERHEPKSIDGLLDNVGKKAKKGP